MSTKYKKKAIEPADTVRIVYAVCFNCRYAECMYDTITECPLFQKNKKVVSSRRGGINLTN